MDVTVEKVGDITIIRFQTDRLDANNAGRFKKDAEALLQEPQKLVVDMSALRFVDSSGLGALLSCLRRVSALGGSMRLCCLQRPVTALMELVRMHRVFDIYPGLEEAMSAESLSK